MKPYYEDDVLAIHQGNALMLPLADETVQLNQYRLMGACIIKCFDLIKQRFSQIPFLLGDISAWESGSLGTFQTPPQFHAQQGLALFYKEIRQQEADTLIGLKIPTFPRMEWLAILRRWFLDRTITTKTFVEHIRYFWGYLFKPYPLIKYRNTCIAYLAQFIRVSFDGDITVTINAACKVYTLFQSYIMRQFSECFTHTDLHLYYNIPHCGGQVRKGVML